MAWSRQSHSPGSSVRSLSVEGACGCSWDWLVDIGRGDASTQRRANRCSRMDRRRGSRTLRNHNRNNPPCNGERRDREDHHEKRPKRAANRIAGAVSQWWWSKDGWNQEAFRANNRKTMDFRAERVEEWSQARPRRNVMAVVANDIHKRRLFPSGDARKVRNSRSSLPLRIEVNSQWKLAIRSNSCFTPRTSEFARCVNVCLIFSSGITSLASTLPLLSQRASNVAVTLKEGRKEWNLVSPDPPAGRVFGNDFAETPVILSDWIGGRACSEIDVTIDRPARWADCLTDWDIQVEFFHRSWVSFLVDCRQGINGSISLMVSITLIGEIVTSYNRSDRLGLNEVGKMKGVFSYCDEDLDRSIVVERDCARN